MRGRPPDPVLAGALPGRRARRPKLVVFMRAPILGAVKTRLAVDIGSVAAVGFYRASSHAVLRRLARDPRWETWLFITGDGVRWPPGVPRRRQACGDLGRRMDHALRAFGTVPVAIIGTDIPAIDADHIAEAFRLLRRCDVVFGPAEDGGYWLVGQRRSGLAPELFSGVRWSSEHALADTLANLGSHRRHGFAATLFDVDDGAAWTAWRRSGRRA